MSRAWGQIKVGQDGIDLGWEGFMVIVSRMRVLTTGYCGPDPARHVMQVIRPTACLAKANLTVNIQNAKPA